MLQQRRIDRQKLVITTFFKLPAFIVGDDLYQQLDEEPPDVLNEDTARRCFDG